MQGVNGGQQALYLLYACGVGFLLGGWYHFFCALRVLVPPTIYGCFIQDVLFGLSTACITFFAFLAMTDGVIQPYLLCGEAVGFFSFHFTIGKVFLAGLKVIRRFLKRISVILSRKILRPINILTEKGMGKIIAFSKKCRKNHKKS